MPTSSSLESRLAQAMDLSGKSVMDLAKACDVSRQAVGKWLKGGTANLKLANFYAVVDLCRVDARWLATGYGSPRPSAANSAAVGTSTLASGLPEMALRVARKWNALDDPAKSQVLSLIETIGALQSESYRKWAAEQQRIRKTRTVKE